MTKVYGSSEEEIATVASLLAKGEVVAVPTETVYGLAAHAFDLSACRRIFAIKQRPLVDPLIVHLFDREEVSRLAHFNAAARALGTVFWPGPLTMVLRKKSCVPDLVTANCPTVALRIPSHPLLRRVLQCARLPLAVPSANPFGYVSPTRPEHILHALGDKVDHLLDGGTCTIGVESTIVDLSVPARPRLLRPGAITVAMISEVLKRPVSPPPQSSDETAAGLPAPGLLPKHYSPHTQLVLLERGAAFPAPPSTDKIAAIFFQKKDSSPLPPSVTPFWLTEGGSVEEAARRLFHLLQTVDREGFAAIYIELVPEKGVGVAINDRLRRASC